MTVRPKGLHLIHLVVGYRGIGAETGHPIRFFFVENGYDSFFGIHLGILLSITYFIEYTISYALLKAGGIFGNPNHFKWDIKIGLMV